MLQHFSNVCDSSGVLYNTFLTRSRFGASSETLLSLRRYCHILWNTFGVSKESSSALVDSSTSAFHKSWVAFWAHGYLLTDKIHFWHHLFPAPVSGSGLYISLHWAYQQPSVVGHWVAASLQQHAGIHTQGKPVEWAGQAHTMGCAIKFPLKSMPYVLAISCLHTLVYHLSSSLSNLGYSPVQGFQTSESALPHLN